MKYRVVHLFIYDFQCCSIQHMGSAFPDQKSNLHPSNWKHGILTTGPPGKLHRSVLLNDRFNGMWIISIKKVECQRIDAFELWYWKRLLRVPWTSRRSNQSILKKIQSWKDWYWSWNSNILATWCKELTHWKKPWSWERLKAGGEEDDRGWDGWMPSPTWWTWVWISSGS